MRNLFRYTRSTLTEAGYALPFVALLYFLAR